MVRVSGRSPTAEVADQREDRVQAMSPRVRAPGTRAARLDPSARRRKRASRCATAAASRYARRGTARSNATLRTLAAILGEAEDGGWGMGNVAPDHRTREPVR
jgi:hypothetical protein